MDTKSVEVTIDGKIETIRYKTNLTYGEQQKILGKTYDAKNPFDVKFNSFLYQRLIFETVITEAPFKSSDWTTIYGLEDDIVNTIMEALMEQFPLDRYFKALEKMLSKKVPKTTT